MKTTVARVYRFHGEHSLPGFSEPWCFPHRHDYIVEVVVGGGTPTELLDEKWEQVGVSEVVDVNAIWSPSTVEKISEDLLEHFGALQVTVWEDGQRWGRAER